MADGRLVIVWFRNDLRLGDNPALVAAARTRRPVVCLYVLGEAGDGVRPLGGAARWWLAGSLRALDADLREFGNRMILRRGAAADIVPALAAEIGAERVCWNQRYDPAEMAVDRAVADALAAQGIAIETCHANLLFEPSDGTPPPRVFTPFWRRMRKDDEPRRPLNAPRRLEAMAQPPKGDELDDWALEPTRPDWADGLRDAWTRGEKAGRARLRTFLAQMSGYASRRERPDDEGSSRLSPYLRFGELSPFQVWHAARFAAEKEPALAGDVEKFLTELGWREFSYHVLHGFPQFATCNLQRRFDAFPWRNDAADLRAWQAGLTGYPIVDAGMRQLWQTGWMHNRVRMVVASFLAKHLLLDWRSGEAWFWDTLVDADPANNPANWQWVAGSGADAAPYFRIFNPVLQGETFDPDGHYVRAFVPELARLPSKFVHKPWAAPEDILAEAGVTLGEDYPMPIVDHAEARKRALAAFRRLKDTD